MAGEYLTGTHRVRATWSSLADSHRLLPRTRHRMELRRHALKLRYWGVRDGDDDGLVLDMDWTWVKTLPGLSIGELRVHDTIGGHDNLRIFFFVGDESRREPLPMIWVLMVIQKKQDRLTPNQVTILKARRRLVMERFYNN